MPFRTQSGPAGAPRLTAVLPSLCWTTNPAGHYKYINRAAARFLGAPAESLLGTPWLDAVHPSDKKSCEAAFAAAFQSREPFQLEHRLRRHDGLYRWVLNTTTPIDQPGAAPSAFITSCLDITALHEATERLQVLSLATEQSPVSIIITGASGDIEYVNPKFTALTGYSLAEVKGKNPRVLKSGETPSEAYRAMWSELTAGREWRGEFHNRRKDGTLFWESSVIAPVRDSEGNITHFFAVKEDITERKRFAAEVAEAQHLAQAAERAKVEFLNNMSHELRTPMNGILGMAYLLNESASNAEYKTYLDALSESAQALLDFLSQVLELARLSEGPPSLQMTPFSLPECLAQSTGLFSAAACEKGLELRTHIAPGVPAQLTGDCLRLRQVLANLLGNSVKFSSSGTISVTVEPDPSHFRQPAPALRLQFSVRDHGIGIAPERLSLMFEPFEQADQSLTRKYAGAGLGLALSRKLVEAMGGRIWATSQPGIGSTFFFTAQFLSPSEVST